MDDLDLSPGDTPIKKTRKPSARRGGRASAEASGGPVEANAAELRDAPAAESSAEAASGNAAPLAPKRVRTRRGRTPSGLAGDGPRLDTAPELFTAPAESPRPGSDADSGRSDAPSFTAPAASLAPVPPPAPQPSAGAFAPETAPATEHGHSAGGERAVFVPAGLSRAAAAEPTREPAEAGVGADSGDSDPGAGGDETADGGRSSEQAPGPGGGASYPDAGGGQGRREDKKSWWERKKEKKRQKWLERHGGAGGPGGPGGGGAPHGPGGGHSGGHPGGRERGERVERERNPAQPPPPSFHAPLGALPSDDRLADFNALEALADEFARDPEPIDLTALHAAGAGDLAQLLRTWGETVVGMPPRRALVEQAFAWAARGNRALRETGVLDLNDAGHGFVVHRFNSYRLHPESTFVPATLVKHLGLRRGQEIELLAQPPKQGERCPAAVRIRSVMGTTPALAREVTVFEELIPYYPTARILVEAPEIHKDISMRAVDLLTPVGFGQRGLIVAPPRTGKTVLLQNIANSVSQNYPEATLILLLIDERPEEVTDFKRHTKGEVVSSTFDEAPESHVHAAEMVIERARRLVETGKHVVILLDSITRLARAYNALAGNGGKTMSGGLESNALQRPKRFFGSARNIEGGGSLTILATALIDTNSRMDEVIFEEFKGTGNMELHLDRGLSDKRIFPAINIDRSGTRKEELIYHPDEMLRVYGLRRAMQGIPPVEAMDMFIQRLKKTRTNTEFLLSLNR